MSISILLTQGYEALVDDIDRDLADVKWCAQPRKYTAYAIRTILERARTHTQRMHRVILSRKLGRELECKEEVDHIDRNGLNNQRENLRLATHAQNQSNKGKYSNNTSGYKDVTWSKRDRKWQAQIKVNSKNLNLGLFDIAYEGHLAYLAASEEYHGEFARGK